MNPEHLSVLALLLPLFASLWSSGGADADGSPANSASSPSGDDARAAREGRYRSSPQWRDGTFHNALTTRVFQPGDAGRTFGRFLRGAPDREPKKTLPTAPVDVQKLRSPPADDVQVTWFGHSTVFIQVCGFSVLTDPQWSERASPVAFAGPKRFHPTAMPLEDLPDPDVVIVSHNHYDHLDRATVRSLAARGLRFVVPLGVGGELEDFGVPPGQITELDWWEQVEIVPGRFTLTATPAQHFSGRGPFDRNKTLWASWVIAARGPEEGAPLRRVFFGADGGLQEAFTEIGRRFGPFEVTMLEIGAWDPAWSDIHLGPWNAAKAHEMLGRGVLLPIHWGTFNLGLHAWYEPPEQLLEALEGTGTTVAFPMVGQTFAAAGPIPADPWWRPWR
jgi:L-ascorbate metabolism protein UlaG (beta-lactamase superfamily)